MGSGRTYQLQNGTEKMTRQNWILIVMTVSMLSSVFGAERPNVILIITDDQGYGDVSAHGSPVLKTPHLDRFREQSVSFTDFHVAPMCSPTRGQLMTGLDAMRNGSTAVCQGRSMMRADLPTMANFFSVSGYATGHFGKWHLGDSYPHRPQDRGFQETIHHRAWGITSLADHWENQTDAYFDPVLSHNGVDKRYEGYCTDIFFGETMQWIDHQAGLGPTFLRLSGHQYAARSGYRGRCLFRPLRRSPRWQNDTGKVLRNDCQPGREPGQARGVSWRIEASRKTRSSSI